MRAGAMIPGKLQTRAGEKKMEEKAERRDDDYVYGESTSFVYRLTGDHRGLTCYRCHTNLANLNYSRLQYDKAKGTAMIVCKGCKHRFYKNL